MVTDYSKELETWQRDCPPEAMTGEEPSHCQNHAEAERRPGQSVPWPHSPSTLQSPICTSHWSNPKTTGAKELADVMQRWASWAKRSAEKDRKWGSGGAGASGN